MKYKIGVFIILFFFLFGLLMNVYINTDKELAAVPDKIIRLHVIANSDSPFDQQLKLKVRDSVIGSMGAKFESLGDIAEVRSIIRENLREIEAIAEEAAEGMGRPYNVKADFGMTDFPTRVYGDFTLPAGTYQSLNIVIGEGAGKNWWCVMFPPLCFIDVAQTMPEKTMKQLRASLSDEEYKLLFSAGTKGNVPVKLRFKIFELAKSMNLRLAEIVRK